MEFILTKNKTENTLNRLFEIDDITYNVDSGSLLEYILLKKKIIDINIEEDYYLKYFNKEGVKSIKRNFNESEDEIRNIITKYDSDELENLNNFREFLDITEGYSFLVALDAYYLDMDREYS